MITVPPYYRRAAIALSSVWSRNTVNAFFEMGLTSGAGTVHADEPDVTSTHVKHDANAPVIITPIG